jgi:hypothetical protein
MVSSKPRTSTSFNGDDESTLPTTDALRDGGGVLARSAGGALGFGLGLGGACARGGAAEASGAAGAAIGAGGEPQSIAPSTAPRPAPTTLPALLRSV